MGRNIYAYTDKALKALRRQMVRRFAGLKSLARSDEIHVLSTVRQVYIDLEEDTRRGYLLIAEQAWRQVTDTPSGVNRRWLDTILGGYDPVTGYVFDHECERKRARLAESLVAALAVGKNGSKEIDTALRLWSGMVTQYAIEITDAARKAAMEAEGVDKVMWQTRQDERRCAACKARHGKVYPLDKVPPKPHIGCRCYLIPFHEGGN